tara:strand:+ start:231 stop:1673 length:1443 start_codon:yes stop_codon:yes gene_type:complete
MTKLLGLRIGEHDSNLSYFDGKEVHYIKYERKFQIKHYGLEPINLWEDILKEHFDITSKDLNEIALVFDSWMYGFDTQNESFFPSISYDSFPTSCPIVRVNHHYAHHLSCWPIVKNPRSYNGVCIDGFGDYDKAWTTFKQNQIIDEGSVSKNGSIGLGMASLGKLFDIDGHDLDIAGKIMSYQSYGKVDLDYLVYLSQYEMKDINYIFNPIYYNNKWQNKIDWLKTIHDHLGNVLLDYFTKHFTKEEVFLYTGGTALNVCWNTKLKDCFQNIVIPPHTGDEGLSLGALEFLRIKHKLPNFNLNNFPFCQTDEQPLKAADNIVIQKTTELLANQKIIGWYQGNGEIGPRALGHRSILADVRDKEMKDKVNQIKKREHFRPFGCSTIDDEFSNSDYMLFADSLKTNKYPAITHIDNTCRHQKHGPLQQLLQKFKQITSCGSLLNTSLNIDGKPLASSKINAMAILENSKLDGLVYGNEIYLK